MNNKNYDIHERIFKFIVNVIKFLDKLPKTQTNLIFINQITRSVSSMVANDQEADGASTKKDFIAKYYIVKKETKETKYWLSVIMDTNLFIKDAIEPYIEECQEILMIVSKIINNTKSRY